MVRTLVENKPWSDDGLALPKVDDELDRYHESLLAARLGDKFNWGVLHVQLDERALQRGMVALIAFEGVMPDGTPLVVSSRIACKRPEPRPLMPSFRPGLQSQTLYIAVRSEKTLRDVRLLFGAEPRDGYSALPIARFVRDRNGQPRISTQYIPPCLRTSCARSIAERIERLLHAMTDRLQVLIDARRAIADSQADFSASDVMRYLQLHALNAMFPSLYYAARAREVSPRTAFSLLAQLAVQLETLAAEGGSASTPAYNHLELAETFDDVFAACERKLYALQTEPHVSCALQSHGQGRFVGELRDQRFSECRRFYLGVECGVARNTVIEETLVRAKLAAHGDIGFVMSCNLSGVQLRLAKDAPFALPTRPGLTYFELPPADIDVYWQDALRTGSVVACLPASLEAAPGCQLRLYGVKI